jgi:hypothetical protein
MVACEHPGGTYDIETVDGTNYVWLDPQIGTTDSPQFVVGDRLGDFPSTESLFLFELEASDTDNDTVAETLTLTEYKTSYKGPNQTARILKTAGVPGSGNEPGIDGISLQDPFVTGGANPELAHREVDESAMQNGDTEYTRFTAGDDISNNNISLRTGIRKDGGDILSTTLAVNTFGIVGAATDDLGDSGLTIISNPIPGQGGASIVEQENNNVLVSSSVGDQDIVLASSSSGKVTLGSASAGDIEIAKNSSGNIKVFADIFDSSDNKILDESEGQIVRAAVDRGKVTEQLSPSNGGPATVSAGVEQARITPDGTNEIDLSNVEIEGWEITVVHTGGSNTPTVSFTGENFVGGSAPANLTNEGDTTTLEFVGGVSDEWLVKSERSA